MSSPLHPSILTVWRIKLAVTWTLVTIGLAVYELFRFFGGGDGWLPPGVRTAVVLVLAIAIVLIVPALRYRFWRYELREDELFLQRGIYNRVRTTVPLRRIQHLDVSQDLLEKEFGLAKLIVHTAGIRGSSVVLPGLDVHDAEALRDRLKSFILEDAV